MTPFVDELIQLKREGAAAVLATVIEVRGGGGVRPGDKCLICNGIVKESTIRQEGLVKAVAREADKCLRAERSQMITVDIPEMESKIEVFFEVLPSPPKLIVVGAGHIAVPLVRMAKILDYHITVLDDRVLFANRERFPDADEILVDDMAATLKGILITPSTYIVLITRGHKYDEPCLRETIHSEAKYIGMIGSKRRIKACFHRFREEEKIAEEVIEKVHAPIGIDVSAETPEEIALCILAEIIKVRRGGAAQSLSGH